MLRQHRLLSELLRVVLLHVVQLDQVWVLGVVNDRLDILLQFLHDVLVLQLLNVAILSLDVGVE